MELKTDKATDIQDLYTLAVTFRERHDCKYPHVPSVECGPTVSWLILKGPLRAVHGVPRSVLRRRSKWSLRNNKVVVAWLTASSRFTCLTRLRQNLNKEEAQVCTYQYFLHLSLANQSVLSTANTESGSPGRHNLALGLNFASSAVITRPSELTHASSHVRCESGNITE
jgi:hypothetical protein